MLSETELCQEFLRQMYRIRRVEEAIAGHYSEQRIRCPVHLSIGQEAVAVGVCGALEPSDQVMSSHRSHAHFLAKGGDLNAMIAELYGKATGCCRGRGGSMHLLDLKVGFMGSVPIVAATIPIATGLAFANHLRGDSRVVVSFFGEAATEEGVFHESVSFASLHNLPIVFACENNLYSVYSPMSVRQPSGRMVFEQALAHGLKASQVDGNDVQAVYRSAKEAVDYARSRSGPVFLEYLTYRWREHCGPNFDNEIGYRSQDEFERWRKLDPIARIERVLSDSGQLDMECLLRFKSSIEREIEGAFEEASLAPFPEGIELLEHVHA